MPSVGIILGPQAETEMQCICKTGSDDDAKQITDIKTAFGSQSRMNTSRTDRFRSARRSYMTVYKSPAAVFHVEEPSFGLFDFRVR